MLDPAQRRKLALSVDSFPDASPAAKTVACEARKIIQRRAAMIAGVLRDMTAGGEEIPARTIHALVKPVGDSCNLRCRYCFNNPGQPLKMMSQDVLERIVRQTLEYCPSGATFILHGGEPLLAGKKFFEDFIALQNRYRKPRQIIRNSVTTNGTLLDEEWGRFLSGHGIGVSVSIDGPPHIHDANRVDAAGNGSMARVLKGVKSAQAGMGEDGINSISVVSFPSPVPPAELYGFIASLGIRRWRANPCRSPESSRGYGRYVEGLFDFWCASGGSTGIAIISDILEGLLGYSPGTCWMKGSCSNFIGFEPDGTVSPCCEMTLDPVYHFGNILETPLADILEGPKAEKFWADRAEGDRRNCEGCEWTGLCKGGCTYLRLQNGGTLTDRDYLCEGYKDTFRRIANRVDHALTECTRLGSKISHI